MLVLVFSFWQLLGGWFWPAVAAPQPLVLQPAKLAFTPREYYFATVAEARPQPGPVAVLLSPTPGGRAEAVDLQGGALPALRAFVRQSVPANPVLRPVTLRVQELRIQETAGAGGTIEGQITVAFGFDWQREGETVPLTQYRGGARYRRLPSQRAAVEPALRQALVGALTYFDAWVTQQAPRNVALARRVQVRFQDDARAMEGDTLFYQPQRPLVWADFSGTRRSAGNFAAAVFPSFAYTGRPQVVNGTLHLDLTLQVFVVRSSSWTATQDAYSLNHEQRHFDLVKLVGERFKRKVQPDSLTVADYNSIIQLQYLRSYWEMNRVQEQYEAETQHGTNEAAQQRWNQRIDAELRAFGVKPS
ncbi:hypothetical protein HER32_11610 [Hymenobacter sp. BT18]|uniref:hypothetical protein n=1 Tax=Hymenobacter sp. BT18 TaxID=2835648 RepID=UPI00143E3BEE|nr:hypothetical protein [Hymenobacter sp. BT18]QIX61790.1 hypothetical protein HER32_11610 [Hymenobacter sp. BT18]